jgi:hypothetical protein
MFSEQCGGQAVDKFLYGTRETLDPRLDFLFIERAVLRLATWEDLEIWSR